MRVAARAPQIDEAVSVPKTARKHFDEDIARAWALHGLAAATQAKDADLALDAARTAVAFGVGALDAYLCDAFSDTLARSLKHSRQKRKPVPPGYQKLALPIGPLLGDYEVRDNWGLRMAARALMEKDNMLQLGRLKEMFNPALPPSQRLWPDLAPRFAALDRKRLTGYKAAEFQALTGKAKTDAPPKVTKAVLARMGKIVQRRHDIVHNCDRPKVAKQPLTITQAKAMLRDVQDFTTILDDHLQLNRLH
jgi:hypothetical protein